MPPVALDTAVDEEFYSQPGFVLIVLGMFAVTGLLLVAVGIYGVLAYTVSQQTRDIAIRLAVGGERGDILRLVLTRGLRLVVLGAVLGLLSSLGTNRLLESQLWQTSPHDFGALAADHRRSLLPSASSPAWCRRCGRCASNPCLPSDKNNLGTVPKARESF